MKNLSALLAAMMILVGVSSQSEACNPCGPIYQPVPVIQPVPVRINVQVPVFVPQPVPVQVPVAQPVPVPVPVPQPVPVQPINPCAPIGCGTHTGVNIGIGIGTHGVLPGAFGVLRPAWYGPVGRYPKLGFRAPLRRGLGLPGFTPVRQFMFGRGAIRRQTRRAFIFGRCYTNACT